MQWINVCCAFFLHCIRHFAVDYFSFSFAMRCFGFSNLMQTNKNNTVCVKKNNVRIVEIPQLILFSSFVYYFSLFFVYLCYLALRFINTRMAQGNFDGFFVQIQMNLIVSWACRRRLVPYTLILEFFQPQTWYRGGHKTSLDFYSVDSTENRMKTSIFMGIWHKTAEILWILGNRPKY